MCASTFVDPCFSSSVVMTRSRGANRRRANIVREANRWPTVGESLANRRRTAGSPLAILWKTSGPQRAGGAAPCVRMTCTNREGLVQGVFEESELEHADGVGRCGSRRHGQEV